MHHTIFKPSAKPNNSTNDVFLHITNSLTFYLQHLPGFVLFPLACAVFIGSEIMSETSDTIVSAPLITRAEGAELKFRLCLLVFFLWSMCDACLTACQMYGVQGIAAPLAIFYYRKQFSLCLTQHISLAPLHLYGRHSILQF